MPGSLALGFLAQYTIMPVVGWSVARLLNLEAAATCETARGKRQLICTLKGTCTF